MCEYCGRRIHAPGCPNAEVQKSDKECFCCASGLDAGEEFVELGGVYIHRGCLTEYLAWLEPDALVELLDLTVEKVAYDEY